MLRTIPACLAAGLLSAQAGGPPDSTVVGMAQHLVQEHVMLESPGHYHIEFDMAYLYPQPDPNYWAVVGGYVSDQSIANSYVAAVRLVCPTFDAVDCWRLEKLAVNDAVAQPSVKPWKGQGRSLN